MPTLNWTGKDAVVNHHLQVPFHLLKDVPDLACGQPGDGNLIVQSDNLVDKSANGGRVATRAVLAKLPPFDGQKVIYCAGCLLGRDRLNAERIIVRQTPYEIKVS